jgi:hypothetical protein
MIGIARQPVKVAARKWNREGEFVGEPKLLPWNRPLEWIVGKQDCDLKAVATMAKDSCAQ